MIEHAVEYVVVARGDGVGALRLEEVALAQLCFDSWANQPDKQARFTAVPDIVKCWTATPASAAPRTFGQRQQPLLRAIIEVLKAGGAGALSRDEASLLVIADALNAQARRSGRLEELLGENRQALAARIAALPISPGLASLRNRIWYVTSSELAAAPRTSTTLFPGDPKPASGPSITVNTPVRVLGGVPDNTTLIVANASCTVDGFVLGRIVCDGTCEIAENISGAVVAQEGEIRCRNIIDRAFVVAKRGTVSCTRAQNPGLVFGGIAITVGENATRGRYVAGRISIAGHVIDGELHASELIEANRFSASGPGLRIVLRSRLSIADYGEKLGADAGRLVAEAARLRRELNRLTRSIRLTQHEAERCASNALMHLFSGKLVLDLLEQRDRLERRAALLNRVMAALLVLLMGTEDVLNATPMQADGRDDAAQPAENLVKAVSLEVAEIGTEGDLDEEIEAERHSLMSLCERLVASRTERRMLSATVTHLRDRMDVWVEQRQKTMDAITHINREITVIAGDEVLTDADVAPQQRLGALTKRLKSLRENPPNETIAARLSHPFVRLMTDDLQRRISRITEMARTAKDLHGELERTAELLEKEHKVAYRERSLVDAPTRAARVTGRFAEGVRIYSDLYVLDEANPVPGSVLVTQDTADAAVTYRRGIGRIVQESASSD